MNSDKSKKGPTTVGELPVLIPGSQPKPAQVGDLNIAPTTTKAQDAVAVGQRKINDMWENTQRIIALSVTWCALAAAMYLSLVSADANVSLAACVFLFGVANLVIGFYFGRTNHQKIGGVGEVESGR